MTLDDLPTPCLLVDRARLEKNLGAMQEKADANGVALRPHVKTHKSIALARRQTELGAKGITVAKVAEAERFVGAGFDDVRIAYAVVGREKLARLADVAQSARMSFCVDTLEAATDASAFFAEQGESIEVLLEVNVGHNRCGVDPDDWKSVELAAKIAALPGLRLTGILTHAGQGYHGPAEGESREQALRRVSNHERDAMIAFADKLRDRGLAKPGEFEISIGSTPTMRFFENRGVEEPVNDGANGPAKRAVDEAAKDGIEEPAIGIVEEPVKGAVDEPVKGAVEEPVKGAVDEPENGPADEPEMGGEGGAHDAFRITEIRPGNYVFNDAMQHTLGVARLDQCALTVLTTVISRHRKSGRERLFADAGKKILTSDTGALTNGFGILLYNARTMQPLPHAQVTGLSEEHAWIEVSGGSTLTVGNRIRLVPNHACVAVNTQDLFYVIEGDNVVDSWPVDARGAVI